MKQVWHDLLFAHSPVALQTLRPLIPAQLEIDTYAGQAWIGVVPFRMSGVRPRGILGIRELSPFPELNVRTYVLRDGKPGVWFFSLDASNALAVWGARHLFHLPYFPAEMRCQERDGWIDYFSSRKPRATAPASLPAKFAARYRPAGEVFAAQPRTIEHFLTERYCLYTANKSGRLIRCEIHHPPWPLQLADAEFQQNTMAAAAGISLPAAPPALLHFSRRQDVLVWAPHRIK